VVLLHVKKALRDRALHRSDSIITIMMQIITPDVSLVLVPVSFRRRTAS
jgi:hypothetical protein